MLWFTTWKKVLSTTVFNWSNHRSLSESAALAFYTLFSLAPVLIVTIAIAGAIFGADAVRGRLVHQFASLMGHRAAEMVQKILLRAAADNESGLAAVLGAATVLFGATAVFVQLQSSLNRVWEVAPRPGHVFRTLLHKRLVSFALLLGIGFLLLVSLAISAAIEALQEFSAGHYAFPPALMNAVNIATSFFLFTLLFAMIYRILPDREIAWGDVWLGAVAASIAFQVGKWFFSLYIGRTAVASPYGAAGALVIILLWVFYASFVLLFGAEFTRAHSRIVLGSHPETTRGAKRVKEYREDVSERRG